MMQALEWTWQEYKNWISQNTAHNYQFLFRGQEDKNWILQTTFHRFFPNMEMLLYLNNIILEVHHQLVSQGFESHNLQDINGLNSFLAKLQHHGFPTPLLDWTYSPYIAVYFAIKDISDFSRGEFSVYIFDYMKWITHHYQPINLFDSTYQFVSTYKPFYANNPRLITQQSILTITNIANIEQYLFQTGRNNSLQYLYKINIPRTEIHRIKIDLENMGITENRLFPNIDDICSDLKRHFISNQSL